MQFQWEGAYCTTLSVNFHIHIDLGLIQVLWKIIKIISNHGYIYQHTLKVTAHYSPGLS